MGNFMEKKRYHVVRKQQADLRALLRGLVSAYLLYLGWKLLFQAGSDPAFPPAARLGFGGLFAAAALAFGWYTWKQYRSSLREAELTSQELEELRQEREEEP